MKKKTLKALVAVLSVVLIVCLSVAGTLAYLKVTTAPVTNTFAPSNIDLKLEETTSDYKMIPGKDITKDSDLKSEFSVNEKKFDDYKDLVRYVTYNLESGNYKIIYNISYKKEHIVLEQSIIIK